MAGELKHRTAGSQLSQVEYEAVDGHEVDSGAQGDLLYVDAAGKIVRLPAGTAGLPLKTGGAGANPSFGQLANAALGADVARLNLLTNPGFEIWQRGAGPFTAHGAYTADRWQQVLVGSSTVAVTRIASTIGSQGYSLQAVYTHAAGGAWIVYELVEDYLQLRGKTCTFSAKVKSSVAGTIRLNVHDGTNDFFSPYNVGTGEEMLSLTFTVGAAVTMVRASIRMDVGSATVEVNDAVLAVGAVAANYVPLHPAEEWHRCQRSYEILGQATGYMLGAGISHNGGAEFLTWSESAVRKAVTPSQTLNLKVINIAGADQSYGFTYTIFNDLHHLMIMMSKAEALTHDRLMVGNVVLEANP